MKQKERSPMSWVFEFAGSHKSQYIASILLALVGVAFSIAPYFIIADIVRNLIAGTGDLHHMLLQCLIMAGLWLGRVVFHALSTATSHKATFQVLANIRKRCTDKLSRISLGAAQARSSGELKNILVERIDSIETTLAHIFPEFTTNLTCSACVLIFLFFVNWKMALVSLVTVPIGMAFAMGMMIGQEESYGRVLRAVKNLNDTAVEYIGGIDVIKVFGKTKSSYERFLAAAKEGASSYIDWMRKNNVFFAAAMVILPATLVTVLPVGGWMIRSGSLSVEDFVLILILNLGLVTPLITCMSYSDDLSKLGTIIGEVTSILEEPELNRPETDAAVPADNSVAFRNVHFGYSEKEVLHGIDLDFRQGTVSALVGPSGSGKSTIAKLLASYWDVSEGSITIGGVDIRQLSPAQYYKRIAYVSQDNFLFDDTVRENIRMGNPTATDAMVVAAAKACGCHDFIMSLEKGYDTVVGGAGSHLSGGERQRIAIARAMLKDAPIVILDEATAYTDPENEALIQASVAKLVRGKTLIVIAHRLSTIADADSIFVISDGRVEESGTHQELLARQGLYSRMWEAHMSAKDVLEGGEANA